MDAAPDRSQGTGRVSERSRAGLFLLVSLVLLCFAALPRFFSGVPFILANTWRLPSLDAIGASLRERVRTTGEILVGPRADAALRRGGHESIHGGVLFFPSTFTSDTGAYDLLIHFHGNTKVVLESAEVAGVDALVAVVNLGVGSAPYQDTYGVPGTYEALLEEIQRGVVRRGLVDARLRRVALSSWSAGYGALSSILEVRRGNDPLDALLVLDGIHCGWIGDLRTSLNYRQLAPFSRAARAAATGGMLFTITHSEIDPLAYASARETAGFLLETVGARRGPPQVLELPHLALRSAEGAVAKKLEKRMEPFEEARAGGLHVRGFRGNTPEHHMAHLLQMGATVLPELAAYWGR